MPTYRPTDAGFQTKGTLWAGLDPHTTSVVCGIFGVTVVLTYGAVAALHAPWYLAIAGAFVAPNAIMVYVVMALVVGRPPLYLRDWLATHVLGFDHVNGRALAEPNRETE